MLRYKAADANIAATSKKYDEVCAAFNNAKDRYKAMGGKTDFDARVK